LTDSRPKAYAARVVRRSRLIVAGSLLFLLSGHAVAQAPLPILRGIVVMPTGESRAYLEDAQTGQLGGYAINETVGDSRIEGIRDDRVVLRRGGELIHVFIGGVSSTEPDSRASASTTSPPAASAVEPAPVIANGEAWLEHLGLPPQALKRAIEKTPTKSPDNLEDN